MHYRYIAIILLFIATSFGCSNVPEPLFEMRVEANLSIPAGLNSLDTHYFYIRDIPTRYRNFVGSDSALEGIASVYPNSATISALFANIDWAILREISIHAISQRDPEQRNEVFYFDRLDSNVKDLNLFSSLSEVKDILLQDFITLEVRLNFNRSLPVEIDSRITMNFNVNGPE